MGLLSPLSITIRSSIVLFFTKKGFDSKYWTNDADHIRELEDAPTFHVVNRYALTKSNLSLALLKYDTNTKSALKLAATGVSFVIQYQLEKIAFLYSAWWDGVLMQRSAVRTESLPQPPQGVECEGPAMVEDVDAWLLRYGPEIETQFSLEANSSFKKDLVIEWAYTERDDQGNISILLLKNRPTIRDNAPDVLYVELVCSNISKRARALIGRGGVVDKLATELDKTHVVLSTLHGARNMYQHLKFEYVTFEELLAQDT